MIIWDPEFDTDRQAPVLFTVNIQRNHVKSLKSGEQQDMRYDDDRLPDTTRIFPFSFPRIPRILRADFSTGAFTKPL